MRITVRQLRKLIRESFEDHSKEMAEMLKRDVKSVVAKILEIPDTLGVYQEISGVLQSEMQNIWDLQPDEDLLEEVVYIFGVYAEALEENDENLALSARSQMEGTIRSFVMSSFTQGTD